jgi:hypothetical protein
MMADRSRFISTKKESDADDDVIHQSGFDYAARHK